MPKYRLTVGSHSRYEKSGNVRYTAGDVLELSKDEAEGASLEGRLEPVDSRGEDGPMSPPAAPVDNTGDAAREAAKGENETPSLTTNSRSTSSNPWSGLSELGGADAIETVSEIEDVENLDLAYEAEVGGKNRKTVLAAIEARRSKLEAD